MDSFFFNRYCGFGKNAEKSAIWEVARVVALKTEIDMQKRLKQLLQPRVLFIHEIQSINVVSTDSELTIKGKKNQ